MKTMIRVLCEENGNLFWFKDESSRNPAEFNSVEAAYEGIGGRDKLYPSVKYTVVVEHSPPVPKWRWAYKMKNDTDLYISNDYYATEEEVISTISEAYVEWVQKLDKTERRD